MCKLMNIGATIPLYQVTAEDTSRMSSFMAARDRTTEADGRKETGKRTRQTTEQEWAVMSSADDTE